MRLISCVLAVVLSLCGGAAANAQTFGPDSPRALSLSFDQDGRVTLAAKGVSIREILAEWARQCGCYIVNGDKLTGATLPYPLLYERESQGRVLESLLRQTTGYVLTPQRAGVLSRSNFETIYILPTSTAIASSSSFAPASVPAPAYPMPTPGGPDDELPPIVPMAAPGIPRPPVGAPAPPGEPGYGANSQAPASNVPSPRPPGTATTFVPIVPVGTSQSTPQTGSPGAPTAAPGQPVPMIVPGR